MFETVLLFLIQSAGYAFRLFILLISIAAFRAYSRHGRWEYLLIGLSFFAVIPFGLLSGIWWHMSRTTWLPDSWQLFSAFVDRSSALRLGTFDLTPSVILVGAIVIAIRARNKVEFEPGRHSGSAMELNVVAAVSVYGACLFAWLVLVTYGNLLVPRGASWPPAWLIDLGAMADHWKVVFLIAVSAVFVLTLVLISQANARNNRGPLSDRAATWVIAVSYLVWSVLSRTT